MDDVTKKIQGEVFAVDIVLVRENQEEVNYRLDE